MSYLEGIASWTYERLEERRRTRSLAAALLEARPNGVVAEVKRASPSEGAIDLGISPTALAREYVERGASAVSVLTSERDFGGTLRDLADVRDAVEVPLLAKDFFVDVWQVTEARAYGADAILVILALVTDELAADLIQAAEDLEMEALIEIHDEDELERAVGLGSPLIGVNARDLATLEIDLGRQAHLLSALPSGLLRVAESGIETGEQAARARAAGADALLVGTALVHNPSLLDELVRVG
jgi:indole-3-glycerol phosphate synthase